MYENGVIKKVLSQSNISGKSFDLLIRMLKNKMANVQEGNELNNLNLFENMKVLMSIFTKLWLQCKEYTKQQVKSTYNKLKYDSVSSDHKNNLLKLETASKNNSGNSRKFQLTR